ncbi:AAA family ATPase [Ruegeria marina]|uniref:SAM domain (Sterile alpha motif) n=1 Tax=Ruegeria marina TaxID=639004 RepID=A0A1G6YCR1_9RHOB|nr:adenylate/guanylate cyclase domain-containing protein [Ruegeria marina]SDD87517.1 SAM domain (Sterile alpha motif) [Ruegeria marina]
MADRLRDWLDALDLGKYADAFAENEIVFGDLAHLTEDDLREMSLPIGPRRRVLQAIAMLGANDAPAAPSEAAAPGPAAERRQLTVMFCDLVGSTALSEKLDPEDLRLVMRRYQDTVTGSVARYGGHVAKFLGDGVLVYFGWPRAFEDQAERAVRAALDAIAAVAGLRHDDGAALAARIGIATGLVVVGETEGDDARDVDAVAGATPNLAARLQALAGPGEVVIAAATHRLIGGIFRTESLGPHTLKGFAEPVAVWRLVGEGEAVSRFEATHGAQLPRLVGRDSELAMLTDRWRLAAGGEGQIVVISGEPGIGKSRLMQALGERVAEGEAIRLRYQCSAYHATTALYPLIRQVEHAAGFEAGDGEAARLDKLERLIGRPERFAAFADLMSLAHAASYGEGEMTPQQRKARIHEAVTGELMDLAGLQPVLFLFEDAHWIDPTTEEFLETVAPKIAGAAVLMVVTHRPEWQAGFVTLPHATMLTLNRLGRRQGGDIVREIAGPALPDEFVARIVERADGVPLFIEELTKTVAERGAGLDDLDIPATLQASLIARLDRLGTEAKEAAQVASAIGREFGHRLMARVCEGSGFDLDAALDRLAESELVFRYGSGTEARYTFKHALIQDTAYDSLLRERRRHLHGRIADALAVEAGEGRQTALADRAMHLSRAERQAEAAGEWCAAGEQAARVFALKEAAAHFRSGLSALDGVEPGAERDALELRLRRGLSMPQMMLEGIAAPIVEENLLRASRLSHEVDSSADSVRTGWGLFHIYENMGRWREACGHADEIWSLANTDGDEDLIYQARHAQWSYRGLVGDFENALTFAETGWAAYDNRRHHAQAYEFGWHDPGCCAGNYIAWCSANLGFADRSKRQIAENESFNASLSHPASEAFGHAFAAMSHLALRRFEAAERHAATASAIADEYDLRAIGAMSMIFRARIGLDRGEAEAAIDTIERLVGRRRRSDRPCLFLPMHLSFAAEAHLALGQHGDGLAAIADARRFADMEDERAWWSEILRTEAGLVLARDGAADGRAEALLREAMAFAAGRGIRLQELRAARDLARLIGERGDREGAQAVLAPVCDWFTEGFDTVDLGEARALLDDLA